VLLLVVVLVELLELCGCTDTSYGREFFSCSAEEENGCACDVGRSGSSVREVADCEMTPSTIRTARSTSRANVRPKSAAYRTNVPI